MNEPTELLRDKPLEFMKRYAVAPPDGAGYSTIDDPSGALNFEGMPMKKNVPAQSFSGRRGIWTDSDDDARRVKTGEKQIKHQRVLKGGLQHAEVADILSPEKRGAKTLNLSATPGANRVPIHFLPWNSDTLVDMRLPEDRTDGTDPDNPHIFFTAALSGCSVFVDGHPARPRVVHAGTGGKLKHDARNFWEERLDDLARNSGEPIDDHMRSIDKSMYSGSTLAFQYRQWLTNEYRDTMSVKSVREWASVFGIRYGRLWSFYLQRNCTVTTTRLVKKDSVTSRMSGGFEKFTHTATGLEAHKTKIKSNSLFKKNKSVLVLQESHNKPIKVEEFYPIAGREGGVQIVPELQHMALL